MSKFKKQVQRCFENMSHVQITREVAGVTMDSKYGYIVAVSEDFVVFQMVADFRPDQFEIFPVAQVAALRCNELDRYIDKIMVLENRKKDVGLRVPINITDWESICRSLCEPELVVIAQNENPENESFDIGPITFVANSYIYLRNFNPLGFYDDNVTRIEYKLISRLIFGDEYADIMGKYARERKPKMKKK